MMKNFLLFFLLLAGIAHLSAQKTMSISQKETVLNDDGVVDNSSQIKRTDTVDDQSNYQRNDDCKNLIKSKLNLEDRCIDFHSLPRPISGENNITWEWLWNKTRGISLNLQLSNSECINHMNLIRLHYGEFNQYLELKNIEPDNCAGSLKVLFADQSLAGFVLEKNISTIEVVTGEKIIAEKITNPDFFNSFDCLNRIGAKLINSGIK